MTAAEVEAYARSCGTWLTCKFYGHDRIWSHYASIRALAHTKPGKQIWRILVALTMVSRGMCDELLVHARRLRFERYLQSINWLNADDVSLDGKPSRR